MRVKLRNPGDEEQWRKRIGPEAASTNLQYWRARNGMAIAGFSVVIAVFAGAAIAGGGGAAFGAALVFLVDFFFVFRVIILGKKLQRQAQSYLNVKLSRMHSVPVASLESFDAWISHRSESGFTV